MRVEDVPDPLMPQIGYLDELAKGKKMASILRNQLRLCANSEALNKRFGALFRRARDAWPFRSLSGQNAR